MKFLVRYELKGKVKLATVQVRNKQKAIEMVAMLLTINGHSEFVIGEVVVE